MWRSRTACTVPSWWVCWESCLRHWSWKCPSQLSCPAGKSDEQRAAAALASVLCVQLGPGIESEEVLKTLGPVLKKIICDGAASAQARQTVRPSSERVCGRDLGQRRESGAARRRGRKQSPSSQRCPWASQSALSSGGPAGRQSLVWKRCVLGHVCLGVCLAPFALFLRQKAAQGSPPLSAGPRPERSELMKRCF